MKALVMISMLALGVAVSSVFSSAASAGVISGDGFETRSNQKAKTQTLETEDEAASESKAEAEEKRLPFHHTGKLEMSR